MSPADLLPYLRTRDLGREQIFLERCDSTQTRALDLLRAGAPHGLLVHSEEQTAGRGRAGRRWLSGETSLTFSVVLCHVRAEQAPHYSFVAGLGVRRGLGAHVALKWPNDLWLAGRKVGGVLASLETQPLGIVIGVGLNTGFDPAETAPALAKTAGTLPTPEDQGALLADILLGLEYELLRHTVLGAAATLAEVRQALALRGEKVQVRGDSGMLEGRVLGVADDFALRLQTPEGEQRVQLGDVWPLEQ